MTVSSSLWSRWLQPLESFVARHPRALTATMLAVLGGSAVSAFAVGSLAEVPVAEPTRTVVEALAELPLQAQLNALAEHAVVLTRHDQTRLGDSPDVLLSRLGAFDPAFARFLRHDDVARALLQGRPGKRVELQADGDGAVQRLVARYAASEGERQATHFQRLVIERDAQGQWASRVELGQYQIQIRLGSGEIVSSLFAATDEAGLPDRVATQMADLFTGDLDFHRDLKKGDRFSLVYEALTADGEPVPWGEGAGRVLAAEFVNGGKVHQAVWFREAAAHRGAYFGMDGQSKRRAFLASPMEFSRVSSGFSMRFHPVLRTWRQHNGIDFAAPTGTPVRTVGDGTVIFAGRQNGYGNVIVVNHGGGKDTLYAHLSRMDVRVGQRIEQGQRIGAVGATGWATGPHLHFEFRVNGAHQNPALLARAAEAVRLPTAALAAFRQQAEVARTQLGVARSLGEGDTGAL